LKVDADALSTAADDFSEQADKSQQQHFWLKQTVCDEQQERKQSN